MKTPAKDPGNLRIALVQSHPAADLQESARSGEAFCRQAAAARADIVLFPEMFSNGYRTQIDFTRAEAVAEWKRQAVSADSDYVNRFRELATDLRLAIVITYLEREGDGLRNAAGLIDRTGRLLFTYAKVHTCRFFPMEASLTPGDDFRVAPLDTALGPVAVGLMTCYDREFPESARILMLKGAELILTPNACGLDTLRLTQFRVRAWENAVAVAMASYASGQGDGHSCAFQADGSPLLEAGTGPGLHFADLDLKRLRSIRETTAWGAAWRRPHLYPSLLASETRPPFQRRDAFGRIPLP